MRVLRSELEIIRDWKGDISKPVVSVICTTYNHEPYIEETIQGFLSQETDFPFEIIIHDDASTDKTAKIIREYAVKYPQIIKTILQTENQYTIDTHLPLRNTINEAEGMYFALCEGDDYWTKNDKIQSQVTMMEKDKSIGLVHTNFDTLYTKSGVIMPNTHSVFNIKLQGMCYEQYWNLHGSSYATIKTLTVLVKKKLVQHWLEIRGKNNWKIDDFPLFFYIAYHSNVGYISESTSVYRTELPNSASNTLNNTDAQINLQETYVKIRMFYIKLYSLNDIIFLCAMRRETNKLYLLLFKYKKSLELDNYLDLSDKYIAFSPIKGFIFHQLLIKLRQKFLLALNLSYMRFFIARKISKLKFLILDFVSRQK